MSKIRKVIDKVFPKLAALEENPTITILRSSTASKSSNPFDSPKNESYDKKIDISCIYSEQPEIVTSAANITTQQQVYFYLKRKDIDILYLHDRIIFRNNRYRPVEIQDLFGLWKIKVVKE